MQHQIPLDRLRGLLRCGLIPLLVCSLAPAAWADSGGTKGGAKSAGGAAPIAKVTEDEAKAIALKHLPGKVTGVTIERKKGKRVFVIEIMSESRGEVDVFVDMVTGKVIGTD